MIILQLILSSIYFLLPAYVANMFPVLFSKVPLPLNKPIDKEIFGQNKTYKGFYLAYFGALLILFLQYYLDESNVVSQVQTPNPDTANPQPLIVSYLNYDSLNIFLYAFLFGIGAITGDLIKSFFKRRLGIKPGRPWFPFDQIDLVVGALIFLSPFILLPWENVVVLLLITPLLHFLTNVIGYLLGLKKVWW